VLFLWLAIGLAVFSFIAKSAKMTGVAKTAGVLAFLSFMAFLFGGAGQATLEWLDEPSVPVPDNIPLPGQ